MDAPATSNGTDAQGATLLEVAGGVVRIVGPADADAAAAAELSWTLGEVEVRLHGERVEGSSCRVRAGMQIHVRPISSEPEVRYGIAVARDRMEAALRVSIERGIGRTLVDQPAGPRLRLAVRCEQLDPPVPLVRDALARLQAEGVTFGLDVEAVEQAIGAPGSEVVVATGREPIEGRHGYLQALVDFEELRRTGVLAETPLLRRVRKREGRSGMDVKGRELAVPPARDARMRAGQGVYVDDHGIIAIAKVDGAPIFDGESSIEVRHEIVLETVDGVSGDIDFHGSVRVNGDVAEGRTIRARDAIFVQGNVDRGLLESGGDIEVHGSIMSSVLRAGGERAVAASIADRMADVPRMLGGAAIQARELRDVAEKRGKEISYGLSLQLVLERQHRTLLADLQSVAADLREAGPAHAAMADDIARWHLMLTTAANRQLTPEQLQAILSEAGAIAEDVRRATEESANLIVSYMQASEAEATGKVTLIGKGIFNSRIVAWGGLHAQQYEAVIRGGSIVSHGHVRVREIGSPAGARTTVQLGKSAELEADLVYSGTVLTAPGYTHRFAADRSNVRVDIDAGGSMNVQSLAA